MTGLEKIINEIQSKSDETCRKINEEAEKNVEEIIKSGKSQAEKENNFILNLAEQEYAEIINRGHSGAELGKRRIILSTKQQIIEDAINKGIENIKNKPLEEYFSLLLKMVKEKSINENGTISFNKKDLEQMPKDFIDNLNKTTNNTLKIENKPVNIDSGFILKYGNIEYNCTFDAIIKEKQEKVSDEISKLLF